MNDMKGIWLVKILLQYSQNASCETFGGSSFITGNPLPGTRFKGARGFPDFFNSCFLGMKRVNFPEESGNGMVRTVAK